MERAQHRARPTASPQRMRVFSLLGPQGGANGHMLDFVIYKQNNLLHDAHGQSAKMVPTQSY
jgi:hypothetical protein